MPGAEGHHHADRGSGGAAHTLGPHVVGRRVVVRRLVRGETGPSGGPAMTDLLGVCTAWGDGVCVVQPEAGPSVTIALADIVSGKPVPPRPSVRHRVTPHDAQVRGLALFPGVETVPLGGWLARRSDVHTARRARSVLALRPSGVADDVGRVLELYGADRPVAAVLPGSAEEQRFRDHGWGLEGDDADTVFMVGGVAQALRRSAPEAGLVPPAVELVALPATPGLVTARVGDDAVGIAAYADDWVGLRGIEVTPAARRRGLATAVTRALVEWGAEQGATTVYLQVFADNQPALALYRRLGLREHHRYRYLAPTPNRSTSHLVQ